MVAPIPNTLQEMSRFGGLIRIRCKRCGRTGEFNIGDLSRYLRASKLGDDWRTIRRRFRCDPDLGGCGMKEPEVSWILDAPTPPPRKPSSVMAPPCPAGIDPSLWEQADERERKRLVRQLRS